VVAHGGCDVGVMDLLSLYLSRGYQPEAGSGHGRILIGDLEFSFKLANRLIQGFPRRRRRERAGSRGYGDEFAKNLAARPEYGPFAFQSLNRERAA
jgi:hypothetical protein